MADQLIRYLDALIDRHAEGKPGRLILRLTLNLIDRMAKEDPDLRIVYSMTVRNALDRLRHAQPGD